MPRSRALTDREILKYGKGAIHFRGVFMRDTLPKNPWNNECGVVNLDENIGPGTHWVAYRKAGDKVVYFDSFGNLPPPKELVDYFRNCEVYFNYSTFQTYNTSYCGQLCIQFLHLKNYSDLILKIHI